MSFQDTGLDPRLLRALAKRGFTTPTPVQLESIPKTLEGKDVVARCVLPPPRLLTVDHAGLAPCWLLLLGGWCHACTSLH